MQNSRSPLALAVAGASLLFVEQGVAADITVADPSNCLADLRAAITAVDSAAGDMVIIDPTACPAITVTGESILVTDKPLILSAPVDAQGRPQVSITAGSGTNFGLFTLDDTTAHANISDAVNARIPVIFSGLELTGATNDGAGGAIYANNHAVVLDKSVVSNNTAVGSGGGVAVRGDLCIVGSEITGNTVTHTIVDDKDVSAVGGGAAVRGSVRINGAGSDDGLAGALSGNCVSSNELLTVVSDEFAAAAVSISGLPTGVEVIASQITGNTVDAQVSATDLDPYALVVVGGGGLAVMPDGVRRLESALGTAGIGVCNSYTSGATGSTDNCLLAVTSSIDANDVRLIIEDASADDDLGEVIAGGGGVAVLQAPNDSMGWTVAYSSVSGNTLDVSVPDGTAESSFVSGGGLSTQRLPSDLVQAIPLWGDTYGLDDESYGGSKYNSNSVVIASVVSDNSVQVQDAGALSNSLSLVTGGGLAAVDISGDFGSFKYGSMVTMLSSVSGNTVEVAVAGDGFVEVAGGGVGTTLFGGPGGLLAGKYTSLFSAVSDNAVEVTGITLGRVGGGGGAGSSVTKLYQKPQFVVVDEQAFQDSKYGSALGIDFVTLWTDPGGVVDNTVNVTTGASDSLAVFAAGGGTFLEGKYSFSLQVGTTLSGNELTVDASAATAGVVSAVGGGAGSSQLIPLESAQFHNIKYAAIDDNAVDVTAPASVDVFAAGGGVGLLKNAVLGNEKYDGLAVAQVAISTVSGNTVTASGSSDSVAIGGGLALDLAGEQDDGPIKYDGATVKTSTIANNALSLSGGGQVSGGGVFALMEERDGDLPILGVDKATVVGNTSSLDGEALGGQMYLGDNDSDTTIILVNSLISGQTAQGEKDVYYSEEPAYMWGTSVFHGPETLTSTALAAEIADPAYLGDLQFNGGLVFGGDSDSKYGGVYVKTIALLAGSGAIDAGPGPGDGYDETTPCGVFFDGFPNIGLGDQRGRDVVGTCPDVGAYEFTGDGTELVGTATDLTLGNERTFSPGLVVALPSGDGNSDGIPDVDQAEVATFTYGSRVVTLATFRERTGGPNDDKDYIDTASDLGDVAIVAPSVGSVAIGGARYDLDFGVSFTSNTADGDEEQFELIVDSNGSELVLVKQVCDPDSANIGEWRMLDSTPEPFGSGRVRFTFSVTEGGDYDCNGDGGGIEDPAYVATYDIVPVPTMPWFMIGILSSLSALGGLLGIRRQRRAASR